MCVRCCRRQKTWGRTWVEEAVKREQIMARHLESAEADLEHAVAREEDIKQSLNLSLQSWKDRALELQQQLDSMAPSQRSKEYPVDVASTISLMAKDTCDGLLLKLLFSAWRFIVTCSKHDKEIQVQKESQLQVVPSDGPDKLQTPIATSNLESAMDACIEDARHDKASTASTTSVSPSILRSLFYTVGIPASDLRDRLKDAATTIEEAQARAKSLELELETVKADHRTQMEEAEQREHSLRNELDELEHFYESQQKAVVSASREVVAPQAREEHSQVDCKDLVAESRRNTYVAPQAREEHSQMDCRELAESRSKHVADLLQHEVKQGTSDRSYSQNEIQLETMQHRVNLLGGSQDPAEACRLQNHRRLEMMQRRIDLLQQSTQQLRRASETAEEKQYVCWGSQMLEHHKDQHVSVVCAS